MRASSLAPLANPFTGGQNIGVFVTLLKSLGLGGKRTLRGSFSAYFLQVLLGGSRTFFYPALLGAETAEGTSTQPGANPSRGDQTVVFRYFLPSSWGGLWCSYLIPSTLCFFCSLLTNKGLVLTSKSVEIRRDFQPIHKEKTKDLVWTTKTCYLVSVPSHESEGRVFTGSIRARYSLRSGAIVGYVSGRR